MGPLRLAWRYLSYYWGRTTLLVLCIMLTLLLPFAVTMLVDVYGERFGSRAESTPYVVGAPGSRYDLVLSSLYFRGRARTTTNMAEVERAGADGLATPIPLHVGLTAGKGLSLVGTTHDYVRFRGLRTARGRFVQMPGECVLGATAARERELDVGGHIYTDRESVYDFGLNTPIKLRIVGVLAETETPDDRVAFTDLRTIWIMEGLGHGHEAPDKIDPDNVSGVKNGTHQLNPKTFIYTEITKENVDSFHFHGTPEQRPVTGILLVPRDRRATTFLKGRYAVSKTAQMLEPSSVVGELMEFVFQLKRFFDANVILVSIATILFLGLVVLLSLRVRRQEIETLYKIGCDRLTVFQTIAYELVIVIATGALLAGILGWITTNVILADFLP